MRHTNDAAVDEPVIIVDYDPKWEMTFQALRDGIAPKLGELLVCMEHVGSTSIPGMAAKPIIDIDIVVRSSEDIPPAIERLSSLGYRHVGDLGIAGREAFESPKGGAAHHLYLCSSESRALKRHITFRDYLRSHPREAKEYSALKKALSIEHRHDRVAYTDAKTEFVEDILRKAGEIHDH